MERFYMKHILQGYEKTIIFAFTKTTLPSSYIEDFL